LSLTSTTTAVQQASVAVGGVNTGVAGQEIVALLPAAPIVGGVLSMEVMVCATVPLTLPQASTALQVLVSVNDPMHVPSTVISLTSWTDAVEQASEAVGAVKLGAAGQEIVALLPAAPIVGGVLSTTVIVWLTVAL